MIIEELASTVSSLSGFPLKFLEFLSRLVPHVPLFRIEFFSSVGIDVLAGFVLWTVVPYLISHTLAEPTRTFVLVTFLPFGVDPHLRPNTRRSGTRRRSLDPGYIVAARTGEHAASLTVVIEAIGEESAASEGDRNANPELRCSGTAAREKETTSCSRTSDQHHPGGLPGGWGRWQRWQLGRISGGQRGWFRLAHRSLQTRLDGLRLQRR